MDNPYTNWTHPGIIHANVKSWKKMREILSANDYMIAHVLSTMILRDNNSLAPLSDNTNIVDLMAILDISKNTVKRTVLKLKETGVISSKKSFWIFNPYISFGENLASQDFDIFNNTIFQDDTFKFKILKGKISGLSVGESNHNIYILKQPFGNSFIYKLGYSVNIKSRMSSYASQNPSIKFLVSFYAKDGKYLEREIHKNFESVYKNEWYDKETIDIIIKTYFDLEN